MNRALFSTLFITMGMLVSLPSCEVEGVGSPCIPEQEFDPTFTGFVLEEVNVESKSFQCQTRICLVHHFQGRVSCPYGQDGRGQPLDPSVPACKVPGTDQSVTGSGAQRKVSPQCQDRALDKAVYCRGEPMMAPLIVHARMGLSVNSSSPRLGLRIPV